MFTSLRLAVFNVKEFYFRGIGPFFYSEICTELQSAPCSLSSWFLNVRNVVFVLKTHFCAWIYLWILYVEVVALSLLLLASPSSSQYSLKVIPPNRAIGEGSRQKQSQRSSRLFGGQNLLNSLPRSIWKNRMNSTFSSKSTEAKQLARQGIE